jgi:hypothetical protein
MCDYQPESLRYSVKEKIYTIRKRINARGENTFSVNLGVDFCSCYVLVDGEDLFCNFYEINEDGTNGEIKSEFDQLSLDLINCESEDDIERITDEMKARVELILA